jgi:hypothetical protein
MSEKKKINAGNMAMKILNATEDARMVMALSFMFLTRNIITLYKGMPSKPGSIILSSTGVKLV